MNDMASYGITHYNSYFSSSPSNSKSPIEEVTNINKSENLEIPENKLNPDNNLPDNGIILNKKE